ncbi:sperm microtubule associated protein 2 [Nothobranchius furzeri]|uniref:Sperm microtubule associated protein 2 n=1 Tax=Nothobranchius furzeri TaxID=105023 RepID=A0A8C6PCY9_NOTFU
MLSHDTIATSQCPCHHKEELNPGTKQSVSMATRTQQLARPKPNHLRCPDRRSVYWLDKMPQDRTESTTRIELTSRWSNIAQSKNFYNQVMISPIWEVSQWALRAVPSERLCSLAQPRRPVADWQPSRPFPAPLSRGAQTAVASKRICQLAQPKRRQVQVGPNSRFKPRPLTQTAAKTSARIALLATPKRNHPKYEEERSAYWTVSRAAQSCTASYRIMELSCPKYEKLLFDDYNPYVVSHAALSACPSARVKELSLPLPRKCISKEFSDK